MSHQSIVSYFPGSVKIFSSDRKDSGKAPNPSVSFRKMMNDPLTIAPQTNEYVMSSSQQIIRPSTSYSKRPATSATLKRAPPQKRIMAITEGRGVAIEIGLCIFDVNCCEAVISQVYLDLNLLKSILIRM